MMPPGLPGRQRPLPRSRWASSHNRPWLSHQVAVPRIVIVGCGFGGLEAARALRSAAGATSRWSTGPTTTCSSRCSTRWRPPACRRRPSPRRSAHLFREQANVTDAAGRGRRAIDPRRATGAAATTATALPYDHLIVAAGATHSYFGHDEWEPHAPGPEDAGRRVRDPPPHPAGVRGAPRRETDPASARRLADLRRHRRRSDRRGDGRHAGRDRAPHACRGEFRRIDPARGARRAAGRRPARAAGDAART